MTSSEPLYIVKLIVIIQQTSSDFQLASKHFFNFAEAKVEYKIAPKNPNELIFLSAAMCLQLVLFTENLSQQTDFFVQKYEIPDGSSAHSPSVSPPWIGHHCKQRSNNPFNWIIHPSCLLI